MPYAKTTDFDHDLQDPAPKWVACPKCGHWMRPLRTCEHCWRVKYGEVTGGKLRLARAVRRLVRFDKNGDL